MLPISIRRALISLSVRKRGLSIACAVLVAALGITGASTARTALWRASGARNAFMPYVNFSPSDGTHFSTASQQLSFDVCDDAGYGINLVRVYLNGNHVGTSNSSSGCGGSAGYANVTLSSGSNDFSIYACNTNGDCDTSDATYYYDTAPYVTAVSVSLSPTSIVAGNTSQATATVTWSDNSTTSAVDSWSSNNTAVATVNGSGVVTGVAAGTAAITAGKNGVYGYATITVTNPPPTVTAVSVALSPTSITAGNTSQASATVTWSDNSTTYTVDSWSSDNTGVATVTSSGVVTGVTAGTANITGTKNGVNGSKAISVTNPVTVSSVSVSLSPSSIYVGNTSQASATVTWSDNSTTYTVDSWSSDNTGVATVNSSGVVTGVSAGTANITGTKNGVNGSRMITVSNPPPPPGISVSMQGLNPNGSIARDECLTIAASEDAAYECGDLRLVHPLPSVKTMNRDRAPTLSYNSRHSRPVTLIVANITGSNLGAPSAFSVTLKIAGHTLTQNYSWNPACGNGTCRLVFPFRADSINLNTGWYPDTLQVSFTSNGTNYTPQDAGTVAIVNRTMSPFGAGWWLDGLEHLYPQSDSTKYLWVAGDGSTRVYSKTTVDSVFTVLSAVDRPDTLIRRVGTPTTWQRHLRNGAFVEFDNFGNHIRTVNRQRDTTRFTYANTVLDSIILPAPGPMRPAYKFMYANNSSGNPVLQMVQSPGANGMRMTNLMRMGDWQISQINDPDNTSVGFTWDPLNRIVTRRNRLNDQTTYGYDAAGGLKQVSIDMSRTGEAALVSAFCPAETRSLDTCVDGTNTSPVPLANAVTRYDGPRTDVSDVTSFFINRFGAPDTVVDANLGRTRVRRDPTFPALADAVTDPTGFERDAAYNSRGLLQTQTDVSPFGGTNAVTSYTYDPKWDLVATITAPTSEVSYFNYDPMTGNRMWQRIGPDDATRVSFSYNTRQQLITIQEPGHALPQQLAYDFNSGNLTQTTSSLGIVTQTVRDAVGQDTLTITPTDAAQTPSLSQRTRKVYDVMGRIDSVVAIGAAMSYSLKSIAPDPTAVTADTLATAHTYDAEGQRTFTTALSSDSPAGETPVRVTEGWSYDAIGRVRSHSRNTSTDSTFYDPAGNVTRTKTMAGGGVTQTFDILNRVSQRTVAARTYAQQRCQGLMAGPITDPNNPALCFVVFPAYPNTNGAAYSTPSDVATFTYDAAGRLLTADNHDATIHRQYFQNGALRRDSSSFLQASGSGFTHPSGLQFHYDLSGRRDTLTLASGQKIAYAYRSDNGLLSTVTDPFLNAYRYTYDATLRIDSVVVGPNNVREKRTYDDDDREFRRERTSMGLGFINRDSMVLDAQGRVTKVAHLTIANVAPTDTTYISYTGLGAVLSRERIETGGNWETEEFRVDAFGNVLRSRSESRDFASNTALISTYGAPHRGTLDNRSALPNLSFPQARDTLKQLFDQDGHTTTHHEQAVDKNNNIVTDVPTRNYYGWDAQLRAVQRYNYVSGGNQYGTFEEYRYDALGRRVMTIAREASRPPACDSASMGNCAAVCNVEGCADRVTWTVWDGTQIAHEERRAYPDGSVAPPLYGIMDYVHGLELDHPLAVLDGSVSGGARILIGQWRGLFEASVTASGAGADCSVNGSLCPTQTIAWPAGHAVYARAVPVPGSNPIVWAGSLVTDQQDRSGNLFRRNRYYNPDAGRFTQEDPIGLAGGMNVYGFAGGDPLNSRDPFGLCPQGSVEVIHECYNPAAALGAAIGAVGATAEALGEALVSVARLFRGASAAVEEAPEITSAYRRPTGATTAAQRAAVQGKACVDCGAMDDRMVADHVRPLVKEYYETGGIDKETMRDVRSVQPQCSTCSARQGAELSRYSREQRIKLGLPPDE
jgi:RHS repeat-associated protein